jgi:DNA-binding NarL/FixJ family response regulator
MINVLIADDHSIVRTGLKQIISELPDVKVTGEAGDGHEVLEQVRTHEYHLVLLDISMPGMSGLDVLKQIRIERPGLPVLILTMYPEEQFAVRMLRAGASGYITKESAANELIRAIRKVLSGGRYISESLAERLVDVFGPDGEQPLHELLSDREHQVMRLIAEGKPMGEIAEDLSLSVKTVSTYRARILEKLGLKSNSDIIRYALKHSIVE